jgi:5-methylcytosine-specific restriction endonuclease McrA
VIDHIIPEAAGGQTVWDNLCVACHACNEYKGAQVQAQDPLTDKVTPLFHPRRQPWRAHFCWRTKMAATSLASHQQGERPWLP